MCSLTKSMREVPPAVGDDVLRLRDRGLNLGVGHAALHPGEVGAAEVQPRRGVGLLSERLRIGDESPVEPDVRGYSKPAIAAPYLHAADEFGGGGSLRGMKSIVVRYQADPERADENQQLIEVVFADLDRLRPIRLAYRVVQLDDGVSFIHMAVEDVANDSDS